MTHLDLFSGIGGFTLGASWAGIETVGFCEIEEEPRKVLQKSFPGIPIYNDIKTLKGDEFGEIDIITGGYPCQPWSVAGNQEAEKDDRHLWPEMLRIIAQTKPTWAVCENVYGHIRLGLDCVLHDLEGIGYACQSFVIPSLCAGADHNRKRVFIVANSAGNGCNGSKITRSHEKTYVGSTERKEQNRNNEGCSSIRFGMDWEGNEVGRRGTEPPPIRVDDELPRRAYRNKMIGNAIDPWIAYQIFTCILAA